MAGDKKKKKEHPFSVVELLKRLKRKSRKKELDEAIKRASKN
jgi:hypothetical protein